MNLRFEWDEIKAESNIKKHGISFKEAVTVFGDPHSITIFDVAHSDEEDRFVDMGLSANGRILIVTYTERDTHIRIISCRKAMPIEWKQYER
ncbi:hypothetical protein MNBD_CHLOROFLEXI01-2850 [hydrothermal vent metagenome]|uniref:BrnT family toxin n=1 Tax=hydrothermal vent metagenome TaxID=652676 RepID=A0A3B0VWB8_9ZZZZ